MTADEIIQQLERLGDGFPRQAVEAAMEQRDAMVPRLIGALEEVVADPEPFIDDPDRMLHIYAFYLLAHFREPMALDVFLRVLSLPGDWIYDMFGDALTEDGDRILASVCEGKAEPIRRLATGPGIDEFVRSAAVGALGVQAAWGERSREDVIEDLRSLFRGALPAEDCEAGWMGLVDLVINMNATELLPDIRLAYEQGRVHEYYAALADIEEGLDDKDDIDALQEFSDKKSPIHPVHDMEWWASFSPDACGGSQPLTAEEQERRLQEFPGEPDPPLWSPPSSEPSEPYIAPPKTGRNDPCPCGSGRKYKKCCGG